MAIVVHKIAYCRECDSFLNKDIFSHRTPTHMVVSSPLPSPPPLWAVFALVTVFLWKIPKDIQTRWLCLVMPVRYQSVIGYARLRMAAITAASSTTEDESNEMRITKN